MTSLQKRILKNIVVSSTGCWIYQGSLDPYGYGKMTFRKPERSTPQKLGAHRVSAHAFLGFDLNSPLRVCHKCDTPPCCNPEHLFFGTQSDNLKDCVAKGRHKIPRFTGKPWTAERKAAQSLRLKAYWIKRKTEIVEARTSVSVPSLAG